MSTEPRVYARKDKGIVGEVDAYGGIQDDRRDAVTCGLRRP